MPGGPVNDGEDWYQYDKNNFAPRVSFAWTLNPKTSIRGGYFLVYDRIGSGLATQFNNTGSFGLATVLSSPVNTNNETNPGDSLPGHQRDPGDVSGGSAGVVPGHAADALGHDHVGDRPEPAHAVLARLQPDVQP